MLVKQSRLQSWEIFSSCAERSEPESGLEPRFEALPKTGKSPNTSGDISTGDSSRTYITTTAHKYLPALPTNLSLLFECNKVSKCIYIRAILDYQLTLCAFFRI